MTGANLGEVISASSSTTPLGGNNKVAGTSSAVSANQTATVISSRGSERSSPGPAMAILAILGVLALL